MPSNSIKTMSSSDKYFIREFVVDVVGTTLRLKQKLEGDVGSVVWDASIVLAKYLEELYKKDPEYFKQRNIIELGSGVGCVGLTAASLGANVLLTDLPDIVPLLQKNVEFNRESLPLNTGKIAVLPLKWGEELHRLEQKTDLILLADCIYYQESVHPLISTLKDLCGPQTKILLSQEIRTSKKQQDCWNYFLQTMKNNFVHNFIPREEQNEIFNSEDIVVLELLPRKGA